METSETVANEPLTYFVEKHGVDTAAVDRIVCGRKYSAVLLKNGHIGVCANLLNRVNIKIEDLKTPDLNNIHQRIILNAYFNAGLNPLNHYERTVDIFAGIDFKQYQFIVMIGLFKPLLQKFKENNIDLHVFDRLKTGCLPVPVKDEVKTVKKADAVILTATSIFNGTFMEIVNNTGNQCDVFLLGPSAIMDSDMFRYKNIKGIYGSIFERYDERVLEAVKNGHGTRTFLKFGKKVSTGLM